MKPLALVSGWLAWGLVASTVAAQEKKDAAPVEQPKGAAPAEPAKADDKAAKADDKAGKSEAPASTQSAAPAVRFQAAHEKWTNLDKQLGQLEEQFRKLSIADADARAVLMRRYKVLVLESEKLLPTLAADAEAAFVAAPLQDKAVTQTLLQFITYERSHDRNLNAFRLAKLMIDQKCEEKILFALAGSAAWSTDNFDLAEKWLTIAKEADVLDVEGQQVLKDLPQQKKAWAEEVAKREAEAKADNLPRVKIETKHGAMVLELYENEAPQTVANFIHLVNKKFYDGKSFHRVLPHFMAQGGAPNPDGSGELGYSIYCECYKPEHRNHFFGTLSMALSGKDTGSSGFFITFRPTPHLDGKHTVFGRVIEGQDVLAKIQRRDPERLRIEQQMGRGSQGNVEADKIISATVLRSRPDSKYEPTKVAGKLESKLNGDSKTDSKSDAKGTNNKGDEKQSPPPTKTGDKAEGKTENKTDAKGEPKSEAKSDAKPETKSEPKSDEKPK